jgi:Ca2+-binding RTX toxin-like protein
MATITAPSSGGKTFGTSVADVITGSSVDDIIRGLGGNDVINGGDGNDVIDGDGGYSYAEGFAAQGYAIAAYAGTSSSTAPLLTSMGLSGLQSIWRIRNTSDLAITVVLQSASQGNGSVSITITVPAHSEAFVPSTNLSTHKLFVDGKQVDVKAAGNQLFDSSGLMSTGVDGDDTLSGGNGNDTLRGNGGHDVLRGDAGNDSLDGGTGNDVLIGGEGADKLIGGDGVDTADYSGSAAGVNVNLETGVGKGGDAEGDTLSGIENLIGSKFNDVLVGNASVNMIDGGDGDDTITGGSNNDKLYGGNGNDLFLVEWSFTGDAYDGGAGTDTFSADVASLDAYAQYIDLATGTNNWQDTFVSIENLIGGSNGDKFWGTEAENAFWGRGGNDLLDGRGGDDKLYGETGDDTLLGGAGNDLLDGGTGTDKLDGGIGDDLLIGGAGADTIDGGIGIDTADYSASVAGVKVNLATGLGSGGDAEGDKLSAVENLVGSKFDDVLTGDVNANVLTAGAGNDVLVGSGGGDIMDGGADNDSADYSGSTAGVTVNLATGFGAGGFAAGDKLISIENLTGSAFADILTGNAGINILNGGAGADVLAGGAGADQLNGGADIDFADYSASTAGVTVNLTQGTGIGGDAEGDTLKAIENLTGSKFGDTLMGDAGSNSIFGGDGNDHLYGSGGGDRFDGGNGIDWIDYRKATSGVYVNLALGIGMAGAAGDTYTSIEDIRGSSFGDTLIGDDKANVIYAGTGMDIIEGGGGNDKIYSGGGYDKIDGGTGSDTLSYLNSWAGVIVNLATGIGQYGEASQDTIINIENVEGSKFNDTMTGDALDNKLWGMGGDDVLNGGAGNDILFGGVGADKLIGGDGQDTASYATALEAVALNMATGGTVGDAAGDTYVTIEQIIGSAYDDVITGDNFDNRISGGAGNDTINGGGGIDYLFGDAGNDTLTGGAGADVFVYTKGFGQDVITDFWAGTGRTDRIQLIGTDIHNWADVQSHATAVNGGVMLSVNAGADSIFFAGLTLSQFNADDFLFA